MFEWRDELLRLEEMSGVELRDEGAEITGVERFELRRAASGLAVGVAAAPPVTPPPTLILLSSWARGVGEVDALWSLL